MVTPNRCQSRERLVHQQHPRLESERAGDGDALPQPGKQASTVLLKDNRDTVRRTADHFVVDHDLARRRLEQTAQTTQQGRLAATGWIHDTDELARAHGEGDVPQRLDLAAVAVVGLAQRADTEHRQLLYSGARTLPASRAAARTTAAIVRLMGISITFAVKGERNGEAEVTRRKVKGQGGGTRKVEGTFGGRTHVSQRNLLPMSILVNTSADVDVWDRHN
jgi:hypothetical protein